MGVALITGSSGLIGSEAALHFAGIGLDVVGVDNDMRQVFFGPEASTEWNRARLARELGAAYVHRGIDVRDRDAVFGLFRDLGSEVELDFVLQEPGAVAALFERAGLTDVEWYRRSPVTARSETTERCYVLGRAVR